MPAGNRAEILSAALVQQVTRGAGRPTKCNGGPGDLTGRSTLSTKACHEDDAPDDDLVDRIREGGEEMAYQECDSGGPGAAAGVVSVYEYKSQFNVIDLDDGPFKGPYSTEADAIAAGGVGFINEAAICI